MLTCSAVPWRPSSSMVSRASTSARRMEAVLGRATGDLSLSLSSGASLRLSHTGRLRHVQLRTVGFRYKV